jgi:hypothetical protein
MDVRLELPFLVSEDGRMTVGVGDWLLIGPAVVGGQDSLCEVVSFDAEPYRDGAYVNLRALVRQVDHPAPEVWGIKPWGVFSARRRWLEERPRRKLLGQGAPPQWADAWL